MQAGNLFRNDKIAIVKQQISYKSRDMVTLV